MQLKYIMTREVQVVRPDATLQEAACLMKQIDAGAVPVTDGTRLQGIITDRDIAIRAVADGCDPCSTPVREVMSSEVIFGTPEEDVEDAARLMEQEKIRRLVVVDNDKNLVGIVSLGDIATHGHNRSLSGEALEAISQPGDPNRPFNGNAGRYAAAP